MEIEVKESKTINEGKHEGIITQIEYREEPYAYTDIFIESEGITLKVGYPTTISEKSMLGNTLKRFGVKLEVGKKINPTKILVGKKVEFITLNKDRDGKEFAKVIPDSLKPLK